MAFLVFAFRTQFCRQFHRATPLLLDSLSTFTATELLPYDKIVLYAVVAGTLSLGRVEMKKKILQSPEVNSVLHEIKDLSDFTKSLYECHYHKFFIALGKAGGIPCNHPLTIPHANYQHRSSKPTCYPPRFSARTLGGTYER
ncbi:hypothetical protein JB92DRAFT_3011856 [Gautieria morchelliformis]|nr:hypothetical protein JB92DRAFT_3011856 [Gautieria morchelliformis]